MSKIAVVMFTPPRTEDGVWYGRCDEAVKIAERTGGILILAGDANGGSDLIKFEERALKRGIPSDRIVRAFNGHDPLWKNTRGDARASAEKISKLEVLAGVDEVIVVTCWYHMPRALIAIRLALEAIDIYVDLIGQVMVEPNIEVTDQMLANEAHGCADYLAGKPQKTRGGHIGKPDLIGRGQVF